MNIDTGFDDFDEAGTFSEPIEKLWIDTSFDLRLENELYE